MKQLMKKPFSSLKKPLQKSNQPQGENSRVASGQLKGSWNHQVNESAKEAKVGSPLENAIWEEFGTGEYAAHGDGRKGGWSYQDDSGNWHHTKGKTPNRTLQRAFEGTKAAIIRRAKEIFKELGT